MLKERNCKTSIKIDKGLISDITDSDVSDGLTLPEIGWFAGLY